jgi:hypothetical protein
VRAAAGAQGLANLTNALSQCVFCDVHARPDAVEQLLLLDDPASVLDEVEQQFERLGWEVEVLRAVKKAALRAVEGKVAEPKNFERLEHDPPQIRARQRFLRTSSRLLQYLAGDARS